MLLLLVDVRLGEQFYSLWFDTTRYMTQNLQDPKKACKQLHQQGMSVLFFLDSLFSLFYSDNGELYV